MGAGDVVKYYFSKSKRPDRTYVLGVITSANNSSILIDCEDSVKLKVNIKDFNRIEVVRSFSKEKSRIPT